MNTTLIQNVNNSFYQRRNVLTGRDGEITALVEDYADIYLWNTILHYSCKGKQFRTIPYQAGGNLAQGKSLIVNEIRTKGGDLYIGCVDSDSSYLLRNYGNKFGADLTTTPYLFHTYAYSLENLQCMPSTLADVFTAASSLQTVFRFEPFYAALSNAIYKVFILDLFLRSKGSKTVLSVSKWKNIYPGERSIKTNIRQNNPEALIAEVVKKAKTFERQLEKAPEFNAKEFLDFEQKVLVTETYLNRDNCCLFVYGHELLSFVLSVLDNLREKELSEEKNRIQTQNAMDEQVKAEKLRHLDNEQKQFDSVIRTNMGFVFQQTPIFLLIKKDLAVM